MNMATTTVYQPGNAEVDRPAWRGRLVHRKGHIGPVGLGLLALVIVVTLVMVSARVFAYPGMPLPDWIGFAGLQQFGGFLNQSLTLEWVPPADRAKIIYLLTLPTAALMITLARLTFGIRIMGFRSILLAVGFQEIGVIPSLALTAAVVGMVLLARPAMRRIQLPLFARIAAILSLAAIFMVGALILGPWLRSEWIWSVAFFPVIILAMLAEGVAGTMTQHSGLAAAWRAGWTVAVALLIAAVNQIPALRELVLHCPELMVLQLAGIVLVSEFLDTRLLQEWPARLSNSTDTSQPAKQRLSGKAAPGDATSLTEDRQAFARIAVVRNRSNTGVIGRLGVEGPSNSVQSIQHVVDALRDEGYLVKVFEGDMSLLGELQAFLPPDKVTQGPGGMVLNLATGIQGSGRFSQIPAMLELAGVAYTGPDAIGQMRMLDRYVFLSLLQQADVPVPRFKLVSSRLDDTGDLEYPLVVRPRCEPDAKRTVVRNHRRELTVAVDRITQQYRQEAIVETFFDGPEIRVSLLGNHALECLPLLQIDATGTTKVCPAPIGARLEEQIRAIAQRAYVAAGCRDYARVDVRLTQFNEPRVVQIQHLDMFARKGSFASAAEAGGYPLRKLMRRIVESAWSRYMSEPGKAIHIKDNVVKLPTPRLAEGGSAAA